jgi:cbb3-type cytochrome oxidase cytochrome c subunit
MKLMHAVFGVASVAMLVTTVWMLADDHNRQWKNYQRQFRDIETWTNVAQINEQQTSDYKLTEAELKKKLEDVQQKALTDDGRKLFDKFIDLAKTNPDVQGPNTNPGKAYTEAEQNADVQAADKIADDVTVLAGYNNAAERARKREDLFNRLNDFVARVKFREDEVTGNLKFRKAALDKALASYSIAVGNNEDVEEVARLQEEVDRLKREVDGLTRLQQAEQTHRKDLEAIFKDITADRDDAQKNLKDHQQKLAQLQKAFTQGKASLGRSVLEMPVLDAFNSPLKIEPLWLPDLTLNNNFKEVARFDHCTTCHQAINKTAGSATDPAYPHASATVPIVLSLETPKEAPKPRQGETNANLEDVYGFRLADRGVLKRDDVTVAAVFPKTAAATAGLMMGDVIEKINDAKASNLDTAIEYLLGNVTWGKPLTLTVRRGMPHPFSTHPRLDLFVGDGSPHPMGRFGCTICHQGQGSATAFEWASHTPNSVQQGEEWRREYGWFNNHHWIFPMLPQKFIEASCLKCHHEVVDLEPSARFPDPPAPTLLKGYEIVRNYGCFGCHEINGFNGPNKRIGPDFRTEPMFFAAAAQLKAGPDFQKLDDAAKDWTVRLIEHPEDNEARRRLWELLKTDKDSKSPVLSEDAHRLEAVLKDVETPGVMRRVGPSLRYVASKNGFEFLYSWIRNPRDFRPSTKMPRFFGLWDHLVPTEKLDENGQPVKDEQGNTVMVPSKGLAAAERYEPIEVRSIATYLLKMSQPFEYLKPDVSGVAGSVERGKHAFELRCIACHKHVDFPQGQATQGPDLSRVGAKLKLEPFGEKWLYSWLKNPSHYHARTVMPNLQLTQEKDANGRVTNDQIADITAFLMQSTEGWKPTDVPAEKLTEEERNALYDLATEFLKEKFPVERARQYVEEGIPATRASGVGGAEALLVRDGDAQKESQLLARPQFVEQQSQRLLLYVGRRSIAKYGCFGCHDIPGFEDAKPIGTSLADWGRKDPSRLAFEQIGEYITHHAWPGKSGQSGESASAAHGLAENVDMTYALTELGPTQGWLMEKLLGHEREGFLWQKLHAPRSFDFKKTENKGYNERLRMPQFPFSEDDIQAVMTFVLGLVSEPPAEQYLATYNDNPREKAIIAGTKMVEQFNCGGCHQLDFQRWDVAFRPGELGADPAEPSGFHFEIPHFTPEEIKKSKQEDRSGRLRGQLYGQPLVNEKGQPATQSENEEGDEFEGGGLGVRFVLWRDTLLNGKPWLVGGKMPLVPENRVTKEYPGRGGDLGRWIYSVVVADERKSNPNAKAEEAWGWLPPPLIGEGKKVQTKWLHDFLLEPYAIRPAVVLRMPKFNMSSPEASQLVNFFAARDDAPAPYEFDARTSSDYLTAAEMQHHNRLSDALRVVTSNDYCVKCHFVGDFKPQGSERTLGPQLDRVGQRLRPDYTERWVGNPKRILPYTGMPQNIPPPPAKPISQSLFPGDNLQQLDGVVDLLMNWDRFAKEKFMVAPLVKPAAAGTQPPSSD